MFLRSDFIGNFVESGVLEWTDGGHLWTGAECGGFILRFESTLSPGVSNSIRFGENTI